MLGYYDYTVILTYMNVTSSIIGMFLATRGELFGAIICLLVSGMCDMFDGTVARTKKNRTEQEKKFGIQLDSLADVVCFGAFPAVLGYCMAEQPLHKIIMTIVGVIFVLCAVIRLAYFNVMEEERQSKVEGKRKSYDGLPVTSVALILPTLFCARGLLDEYFAIAYAIVLFLVAVFFVLKIKVRKFGRTGNIVMVIVGILLIAILVALKLKGM